jgi:hypothetical protein
MRATAIRKMRYKLGLTPSVSEPAAMVRWLRHHNTLFHPALRSEWSPFHRKTLLPLSAASSEMELEPSQCRDTTVQDLERKQKRSDHRHFSILIFARTSPILQDHERTGEKA